MTEALSYVFVGWMAAMTLIVVALVCAQWGDGR